MLFRILFLLILMPATTLAATQKLTVILDWYANPDHAPLIIAKENGFFKQAGLDVDLIGPADPADPPKWVAAGKADIAITYEPEFMIQVDQGLPLITIGTLIDKPLNCLTTLRKSHINSIGDLKGKKIATSNSGLSSIMLNVMLDKQGLSSKDVELVHVRYNLSQALLSGQVDAVNGMMRNIEIPALDAHQIQTRAFFPEEYGIPNYSELIYVTHIDRASDPRIKAFLKALKKAVTWLNEHPDEGWELFAAHYPEANNLSNKNAWIASLPYFSKNPDNLNIKEWKKFAHFMQQHHLINKPRPMSDYVYCQTST